MSQPFNSHLLNGGDPNGVPKRPDIPKTSGNFFQLPMPPQLSQFNLPRPFPLFDRKFDNKLSFLSSSQGNILSNNSGPPLLPFGMGPTEQTHQLRQNFNILPPTFDNPSIPLPPMPQRLSESTHELFLKREPMETVLIPISAPVQEKILPSDVNSAVARNQKFNPFLYPQDDGIYQPPTEIRKLVSDQWFDEVPTLTLDAGGKEIDPYKFVDDRYLPNDSAIKVTTTAHWKSEQLGKIQLSITFAARRQIFNPVDNRSNSDTKPLVFNGKSLDLFRLQKIVEISGGVHKVKYDNLWGLIGKQMGFKDDAAEFIKEKYHTMNSKLGVLDFQDNVNMNNKREVKEEDTGSDKRMKNSSSREVPMIKSSAYEYRRSRKSLVLKGFPSKFDEITIRKPGINDDDNSIFEDWISRKKDLTDSSVFEDGSYYTLNEFYEKDKLTQEFLGTLPLQRLEDVEKTYWNLVESGDYFEILASPRVVNYQSIFSKLPVSHSWNFNRVPQNSRSLFKYLPNQIEYLTRPTLSVGMIFSTENWVMEDQMLPLLDYHHMGLEKIWYFISPEDNDKFETLLKKYSGSESCSSLNHRADHIDAFFSRYCDSNSRPKFNTDIVLSPAYLKAHGIRVKKTVQRSGEFIVKYPGVYSYSISLGFTVNESINFAPNIWLEFAVKSESYLAEQGHLSNLSAFEILINISKNCKNPQLLAQARPLFEKLCEDEIACRQKVRSLVPSLVEKTNTTYDYYFADDDLSISFPSVVCLISKSGNQISMSLRNFLAQFAADTTKFNRGVGHFELLVFHEDEKLRQFAKSLDREIANCNEWSQKVEVALKGESKPSIKLLRQLYAEGEKIFTDEFLTSIYDEDTESELYQRFTCLGDTLVEFGNWIELAQRFLLSRHLSRKRKGKKDVEDESLSNDITLERLCEMIKQIPTLSFYTEEMDQLINLTMEIEDYEVSARKFIAAAADLDVQELHNILDLGRSFGLDLPSVTYLQEYERTETWLQTFRDFEVTGLLKTFKSLDSLIEFIDLGKEIKSIRDSHQGKLLKLDEICEKTKAINIAGERIVEKLQRNFDIEDIRQVLHDCYEYPVDPDIRNGMIKRNSEYEEIAQKSKKFIELMNKVYAAKGAPEFEELKESQPKFLQVKTLLERSRSLRISIPELKELDDEYFKKTDEWLRLLKRVCHRQTVSASSLNTHLIAIINGAKATIDNKTDEILLGTGDGPSSNESIYCLCRRGESGTMVECETCAEWYHLECFNLNKIKMKNRNFVCPICEETDEYLKMYYDANTKFRPKDVEMLQCLKPSQDLKFIPVGEYQAVEELCKLISQFKELLKTAVLWEEGVLVETNIDKVRFYLRKLVGCPIDFESETASFTKRLGALRKIEIAEKQKLAKELAEQLAAQILALESVADVEQTTTDAGIALQQILILAQVGSGLVLPVEELKVTDTVVLPQELITVTDSTPLPAEELVKVTAATPLPVEELIKVTESVVPSVEEPVKVTDTAVPAVEELKEADTAVIPKELVKETKVPALPVQDPPKEVQSVPMEGQKGPQPVDLNKQDALTKVKTYTEKEIPEAEIKKSYRIFEEIPKEIQQTADI